MSYPSAAMSTSGLAQLSDEAIDAYKAVIGEWGDRIAYDKTVDRHEPKTKAAVDRRFRVFILEWKLFIDHFGRHIKNGVPAAFQAEKDFRSGETTSRVSQSLWH